MKNKTYCSVIPRMKHNVENCCEAHDHEYGPAGTISRWQADLRLFKCMFRNGQTVLAFPAWIAVRVFGLLFWKR
jgi:hypothetical protein